MSNFVFYSSIYLLAFSLICYGVAAYRESKRTDRYLESIRKVVENLEERIYQMEKNRK